jgi:hypothetical protein
MIKKLDQSSGNVLGFKVSGDVVKANYDVMVPAVEAALKTDEMVTVLLDMTEFKWEKVEAWGSDLKFGREFHDKIAKMAIVGEKTWEKWLTKLVDPFYAKEAKFFYPDTQTRRVTGAGIAGLPLTLEI